MKSEITVKVGGQQGDGIDSTGSILAFALAKQGFHIASYKHFASRIKGGHTYDQIRGSVNPIHYHGDTTDILVVLDKESYEYNIGNMASDGVVLYENKKEEKVETVDGGITVVHASFVKMAEELGNKIVRNMIMLGSSVYLMGMHYEVLVPLIEQQFGKKGQAVVDLNVNAIKKGYEYLQGLGIKQFDVQIPEGNKDQDRKSTRLNSSHLC
jgi:2-oxoglutarate ferredoxin oxidoreductase subunit alpha